MVTVYTTGDFGDLLNAVIPAMALPSVESPGDVEKYFNCTDMTNAQMVEKIGAALLVIATSKPNEVFAIRPSDDVEFEEVTAQDAWDVIGEYGLQEITEQGIEMGEDGWQPIGGWKMPGQKEID